MRAIAAALLVAVLLFVVPSASHSQESPVHIGVLLDDLQLERWQRDSKLIQARAKERGAKVTIKDSQGSDSNQLQQALQLLDSGVNVLIVVPHDAEKAAAIVSAAEKKHVPVISYDRLIKNSPVSLYISFDNLQVGKLQASALLGLASGGNYFLLEGSPSDNNAHQIEKGHRLALKSAEDAHKLTIVDQAWCRDWGHQDAYDATLAALKKSDGKLAAIAAANDDTAAGAVQALTEHKLAGKVFVSGQDADLAAVVRIIRGTQAMTVYKPLGPLSKRAVDAAITLAHGGKLETTETFQNGPLTVPAILLQPIAVDQHNLGATVISDGFHTAAEIKKSLGPGEWEKFSSGRR